MAAVSVPPGFPGRDALAFLASYVKVPLTITEDAALTLPTLTLPDQPPVFGFSAAAFALARQSAEISAAAFLGDGDPAAAAVVEQFTSIADSIISAAAPVDVKGTIGQLQVHTKSQPFLAGAAVTAADILILYAVYPTAKTVIGSDLFQALSHGLQWLNSVIDAVKAPLEPLALAGKRGEAKPEPKRKLGPKAKPAPAAKDPLALIDMRVGQIVNVWPHPDADGLYCERVDIGRGIIRSVVTGVRKQIPIEQMQNRRVIVFVNIKPSKIRGQPSESMLFAASVGGGTDEEKVEMLEPPAETPVGTRVTCGDFVDAEVPPVDKNGKAWKAVAGPNGENLRINAEHVACYKGVPLQVPEGVITVPTLADCEFH
jgi:tRNA-binding EMAP/Myf-like protein